MRILCRERGVVSFTYLIVVDDHVAVAYIPYLNAEQVNGRRWSEIRIDSVEHKAIAAASIDRPHPFVLVGRPLSAYHGGGETERRAA